MRSVVRALVAFCIACGGGLPVPPYVQQRSDALALVPYPPPPARAEFIPVRPASGTVWIDGEWVWRRRRWSWRQGRWVVPPRGARFAPWALVRDADGAIYYAVGAWRDANSQEVADPQAISTATSSAGEVVNPEGEREHTGQTIRTGPRDTPPAAPGPGDAGVAP